MRSFAKQVIYLVFLLGIGSVGIELSSVADASENHGARAVAYRLTLQRERQSLRQTLNLLKKKQGEAAIKKYAKTLRAFIKKMQLAQTGVKHCKTAGKERPGCFRWLRRYERVRSAGVVFQNDTKKILAVYQTHHKNLIALRPRIKALSREISSQLQVLRRLVEQKKSREINGFARVVAKLQKSAAACRKTRKSEQKAKLAAIARLGKKARQFKMTFQNFGVTDRDFEKR